MFLRCLTAKPKPAREGRAGAVQSRHRGAGVSQKPLLPGCAVPSQHGTSGTGCPLSPPRHPAHAEAPLCTPSPHPMRAQAPTRAGCAGVLMGAQECSGGCSCSPRCTYIHTCIHTYSKAWPTVGLMRGTWLGRRAEGPCSSSYLNKLGDVWL